MSVIARRRSSCQAVLAAAIWKIQAKQDRFGSPFCIHPGGWNSRSQSDCFRPGFHVSCGGQLSPVFFHQTPHKCRTTLTKSFCETAFGGLLREVTHGGRSTTSGAAISAGWSFCSRGRSSVRSAVRKSFLRIWNRSGCQYPSAVLPPLWRDP